MWGIHLTKQTFSRIGNDMKKKSQPKTNEAYTLGHSAQYVAKHLELIKDYWRTLSLIDDKILHGLELPDRMDSPIAKTKACHLLIWGVFFYLDGNMLRGRQYLMEANDLLRKEIRQPSGYLPPNDLYSYSLFEIASLHYLLSDMKNTNEYLDQAYSFSVSETLKVIIRTLNRAVWHNRFYMDVVEGDLNEYDNCLDYLRKHKIHYALVLGLYYRLGINVKLDLMDKAFDNYFEGSRICKKMGLDSFHAAFQLALGIWYANHKEWQNALNCYREAYDISKNHYRRALCLENTASLYERYGQNHKKRIETLLTLLDYCEKHQIVQKIPVACLYLAQHQFEELQDWDKGLYFYNKGFEAATLMQVHGIYLFSRAARIVREYPLILEKYDASGSKSKTEKGVFELCLGKDWNQIKNMFEYTLLMYHRYQTEDANILSKQLGLKLRTTYAIREKLIEAGYDIPDLRYSYARVRKLELNPDLVRYCHEVGDLDWKNANRHFQTDILNYLFKHHKFNKMKLSRQLNISYPTVLKFLKELTQN